MNPERKARLIVIVRKVASFIRRVIINNPKNDAESIIFTALRMFAFRIGKA